MARIEDYGIKIGSMPKGRLNKITDVEGVKVGHRTIDTGQHKTGVTVIIPGFENPYKTRPLASSYVINGFGKSQGLVQIEELGSLESIIALTNTLNVGIVNDAIVEYMIELNKKDNIEITSLNPIIGECNDSYLNNIQERAVKKEDVFMAIEDARLDFAEGDVGAGKGMSCYEFSGGIGSSSRIIEIGQEKYSLGSLVLSNFGERADLTLAGKNPGLESLKDREEEGSVMVVIATDLPLSSRQLKRGLKRVSLALARTGSIVSHGSGDIAIGFSTANTIDEASDYFDLKILGEKHMNKFFRAVVESTEEAVLNSLIAADEVIGYRGKREAFRDYIHMFI